MQDLATALLENKLIVIQFLLSLFTSILTSWISVRLSLRKFRNERLWETKFAAYSGLLTALYDVKKDADTRYEAEIEYSGADAEFHKKLSAKSELGWREIQLKINVAELVLCAEAVSALKKFEESTEDHPNHSYLDQLEIVSSATQICSKELKRAAFRDLNLKPAKTHSFSTNII